MSQNEEKERKNNSQQPGEVKDNSENKEKSNNQDPSQELHFSTERFSKILSHERHDATVLLLKHFTQSSREERIWKYASYMFAIFIGVAGLCIAYFVNLETESSARMREYTQRQSENYSKIIANKIGWMRQGDNAILDMRLLHENIVMRCKSNPYSLPEQQKLRRIARFNVMKAFIGSRFIFDEEVFNKVRQILLVDINVPDVCSPEVLKTESDQLEKMQIELDNLMGQSIKSDQELLKRLK